MNPLDFFTNPITKLLTQTKGNKMEQNTNTTKKKIGERGNQKKLKKDEIIQRAIQTITKLTDYMNDLDVTKMNTKQAFRYFDLLDELQIIVDNSLNENGEVRFKEFKAKEFQTLKDKTEKMKEKIKSA